MGKLTTHVLDTALGRPARGVLVELRRFEEGSEAKEGSKPGAPALVFTAATNADGRVLPALLEGAQMRVGRYQITFHLAAYFRSVGLVLSDPPFLDEVVVAFGIAEADAHYHVPLLASPWSFSTYRGS
jgi:5-hydroxyisourate hydrolase